MTGFIIFLIVVGGLYVWFKKTHYNDSPFVKNRIKGRNADQQAVIRYFANDPSCLSKKPISDAEYDQMVTNVLQSTNFKQKALNKIGLDEDQLKEIDPVQFEGYRFDKKYNPWFKMGEDGKYRSTVYQVSWLFFSSTQVYLYQYTFHMDEDGKWENTEEYFYKDVVNFNTSSMTEECAYYDVKQGKELLQNVNTNEFGIIVPGDKFYCALSQNSSTETAIQAMKALLREKKNA